MLSLAFIKPSILFFYRRLFCTGQRTWFDIATKILLFICFAWSIIFFVSSIAACPNRLIAGTTKELNDPAKFMCADKGSAPFTGVFAFIISDVITDYMVLTAPLPCVWRLQMPLRRKIALSAIFVLGGLACVASVLRLAAFVQGVWFLNGSATAAADKEATMPPLPGTTPTTLIGIFGFGTLMTFYSMLETGLALVAACLPTMRFLFTKRGFASLRRSGLMPSKLWSSGKGSSAGTSVAGRSSPSMTGGAVRKEAKGGVSITVSSPVTCDYSDKSTVVCSPSLATIRDTSSSTTEKTRPDSFTLLATELAAMESGRLEEARIEVHSREVDETPEEAFARTPRSEHGDTEWLQRTVSVARKAQIHHVSRDDKFDSWTYEVDGTASR